MLSLHGAHWRRNSVTVGPNVTSHRDRATLIQEGKGVAANAAQRLRESRTLVSAAACDGVRVSEVVVGRVHGRRGKRVAQARPPPSNQVPTLNPNVFGSIRSRDVPLAHTPASNCKKYLLWISVSNLAGVGVLTKKIRSP